MKILQVSPYFFPHTGGIEKYVFRLSRDLAKEEHKVVVFSSMIPKGTKIYEKISGFEVYRFPTFIRPLRNPIPFGLAKNIIHTLKTYDLINCHDEHGFTSNIVALVKLLKPTKTPVVLTSHGCSFDPSITALGFINKVYDRSLGTLTFKMATSIIALSSLDKEYITKISGVDSQRVKVIPNAIDVEEYDVDVDPTPFINKYGLKDKRRVLYVGSLIERKGIHYLIHAASDVVKSFRDVKFVIVGTGSYKINLESYVRELGLSKYFVFTGRISDRDVMRAYKSCDMVVLPSLAEGVPSVIQEALLFSKPVVSSDLPGIHEYFDQCITLIPPANPTILGQAIIRLLEDEDHARKLALEGQRLILNNLNWKSVFHNITSLYKDTLKKLN